MLYSGKRAVRVQRTEYREQSTDNRVQRIEYREQITESKDYEIFRFAQNGSFAVFVILECSEPTVEARGVSRGAKVKDLKVVNKEIFRFAQNEQLRGFRGNSCWLCFLLF